MKDEEVIKELVKGWKRENLCNYCGEKLYDGKHRGITHVTHFSLNPTKPKPNPKLLGRFHTDCLEKLEKEIETEHDFEKVDKKLFYKRDPSLPLSGSLFKKQ